MASLSAVLDACVLVPAALRVTLLRAAAAGLYDAWWSDTILDELERNLIADLRLTAERAARLVRAVRAAFPLSGVAGYEPLIDAMTNHPKDRHVLAAAVMSGAAMIVTSNLRDFPDSALAPHDVEAVSPNDFLVDLFDRDTDLMVQIIAEQAHDLRNPPKTAYEVLDELALQTPRFAALMRTALDQRLNGA